MSGAEEIARSLRKRLRNPRAIELSDVPTVVAALESYAAEERELTDWLLDNPWCRPIETGSGEWIVQKYVGRTIAKEKTKREAVIAARIREAGEPKS